MISLLQELHSLSSMLKCRHYECLDKVSFRYVHDIIGAFQVLGAQPGLHFDTTRVEDSPQIAESTHESTSSGVASDVTSVYPSTTTMTTFKGESTSSACSAKSNASTRLRDEERVGLASRINTFSEFPVNPSREKKVRERKVRASEQDVVQTNNELNGWTQVKGWTVAENFNTCYACNTSDHRVLDPSMYNEMNGAFIEAMKEEHYIDSYGDIRFIESHIHQDVFIQRDRLNTVPSPVSPVPPGGYYYNRDTALSQQQQEQWLGEMVSRDAKLRYKHLQPATAASTTTAPAAATVSSTAQVTPISSA
ncbi:hypothetical protein Btru_054348 [Bulinus truncatus]|nr:hypothetical protein Btru_054348 [Bulinus truncatus]